MAATEMLRAFLKKSKMQRSKSVGDELREHGIIRGLFVKCEMSGQKVDEWVLVDRNGVSHKLKRTMVFLGREECDISLQLHQHLQQSRSVDKRHAVITYDHVAKRFKIKDLSSLNGTYVNDARVPEQVYVKLQHKDTIRFGYDPMTYRIECRDMEQRTDNMEPGVLSPENKIPAWANREIGSMAECQGCIAEQAIKHTCGGSDEENQVQKDDLHHTCNGRLNGGPVNKWKSRTPEYHQNGSNGYSHEKYIPYSRSENNLRNMQLSMCEIPLKSSEYSKQEGFPYSSSETNLRNMQLSMSEMPTKPTDQRMYSNKNEVFSYSQSESNLRNIQLSLSETPSRSSEQRIYSDGSTPQTEKYHSPYILSNSSSVPSLKSYAFSLPKDVLENEFTTSKSAASTPMRQDQRRSLSGEENLETVKKCTPLYGQPSWWGEEDSGQGTEMTSPDRKKPDKTLVNGDTSNSAARPSTLQLGSNNHQDYHTSKYTTQEKYGHVYMDIPIRDSTPDKKQHSPPERDKSGPEKQNGKGEAKSDAVSGMAFTVTLGDADEDTSKSPKISMSESLSKFLPHKVRRSLREKDRGGRAREKQKERESVESVEDPEILSPTRQKKLDDIWGSSSPQSTKRSSKGNKTTKNGYQSEGAVLHSDTEDDLSIRSDNTALKEAKRRKEGRTETKPSEKRSSKSTTKPSKRSKTPENNLNNSQTSYLIEKMFSEGRGSSSSSKSSSQNQPTEYTLYKEARAYDTQTYSRDTKTSKKSSKVLQNVPKPTKSKKEPVVRSTDFLHVSDEEDKVSESGTYTIESDNKDNKEEEEARKSIDQVFGVSESNLDYKHQGQGYRHESEGQEDEGQEIEGQEIDAYKLQDEIDELEKQRSHFGIVDSMEAEIGSDVHHEKLFPSASTPKWVSQWTAAENDKSQKEQSSLVVTVTNRDSVHASTDRKPPVTGRRKPGTGRKLPTPPSRPFTDVSPRSSDMSGSEPGTPRRPSYPDIRSSRSQGAVSDVLSIDEDREFKSPEAQDTKSVVSVDTEVLLKDTEDVMIALEARMQRDNAKKEHNVSKSEDYGSDSDDSTNVLINGEEKDFNEKNKNRKVLKGTKKDQTTPNKTPSASRWRREPEPSVISDCFSEGESQLDSIMSDEASIEGESPRFSRKGTGSKGKGNITMTRPNRAFALRRARAESVESDVTPRSETSSTRSQSQTKTSKERSKSQSGSTTQRSAKSDMSLGAKIVQRSRQSETTDTKSEVSGMSLGAEIARRGRDNNRQSVGQSTNFSRNDGGRHSLRLSQKSGSERNIASKNLELKTRKAKLNTASSTSSIPSSGTQSQPGSRSSSPRTNEMNAWQRRKTYDPRKAVADAKAKEKQEKKSQKIRRSSSFNSSTDLEQRLRSEVSGSEDELSMASAPDSSRYQDTRYSRSRKEKEADDSDRSAEIAKISSQLSKDLGILAKGLSNDGDEDEDTPRGNEHDGEMDGASMFSSSTVRSAFSVPTKSPSPFKSSPPIMLSSKRAEEALRWQMDEGVPRRRDWNREKAESYDSLIVSSIHQLTNKLKMSTEKTMSKMREKHHISSSPSPVDDLLSQSSVSDIPGWKSANQELAGILRNLRKVEHHLHAIDKALFPSQCQERSPTSTVLSESDQKQYQQELERIRTEIAGFKPIERPAGSRSQRPRKSQNGELKGNDYW